MLNHREVLESLLRGDVVRDIINKKIKIRLGDYKLEYWENETWNTVVSEISLEGWELEPKTIIINGIEVPKPLCATDVCPMLTVYVVNLMTEQLYSEIVYNKENSAHIAYLERGLLHSTREDAINNALALLSLTEAKP
jgi:hypothetical protein